jgi:hypothetical protein
MSTRTPFDARTYLQGLVGQTISTITGKPNTIVAVRGDDVFVRTGDTANPAEGEPVPIQSVQEAGDTLYANGRIGINTTEVTHRSAFIGAVLSTLPGAIGLQRPARVELVEPGEKASEPPQLEIGRVYTWEELAGAFGFKPAFFSAAGGMVPSAATNSLLLITHPGGGKSFDYQDHWDGPDLIYTGRGRHRNQQRDDARNLDVAENRRPLFVFEAAGPRRLLFRGRAVNVEERTGRAPDDEGVMRDVLLFRLRFDGTATAPSPTAHDTLPAERSREARPFRDELPAAASAPPVEPPDPEVVAAKREQANRDHHSIVRALNAFLYAVGCDAVTEIPGAIDLWATRADGTRMIFEAKTIAPSNELSQTRAGFAQLHEYRMEYGTPGDELCLVVDRSLSLRRQKLLDALGVAVLVNTGDDFQAGNDYGFHLIDKLSEPDEQVSTPSATNASDSAPTHDYATTRQSGVEGSGGRAIMASDGPGRRGQRSTT